MDYIVLQTAKDDCALEWMVREYMKRGWRPQGGVCVTYFPPGGAGDAYVCDPEDGPVCAWHQAMVHDDDDAPKDFL